MDIVELIIERGGKSRTPFWEVFDTASPRTFDISMKKEWGHLYDPEEQPNYQMWKPLYDFEDPGIPQALRHVVLLVWRKIKYATRTYSKFAHLSFFHYSISFWQYFSEMVGFETESYKPRFGF